MPGLPAAGRVRERRTLLASSTRNQREAQSNFPGAVPDFNRGEMLRLAGEECSRPLKGGQIAARVDFVNAADAVAEIEEIATIGRHPRAPLLYSLSEAIDAGAGAIGSCT